MPIEIKYKGETLETLKGGEHAILHTKGLMMEDDVRVEMVTSETDYDGSVYDGSVKVTGEPIEDLPLLQEKTIVENGEHTHDDGYDGFGKLTVAVPDPPLPIEVSTQDEMTALLATAEVGSVYKYTGTSDIYQNGALYIVEVPE